MLKKTLFLFATMAATLLGAAGCDATKIVGSSLDLAGDIVRLF